MTSKSSHKVRAIVLRSLDYGESDRILTFLTDEFGKLSERTVDLQLGYDFPESSRLSGLSLLLQVNNVNNEPFRTEVSSGTHPDLFFPEEYTEYGRQYLLGFRYKL